MLEQFLPMKLLRVPMEGRDRMQQQPLYLNVDVLVHSV